MLIPGPLYEALPAVYVSGGIVTAIAVESFLAMISGLSLGFAGVLIYILRRNYRMQRLSKQTIHQ